MKKIGAKVRFQASNQIFFTDNRLLVLLRKQERQLTDETNIFTMNNRATIEVNRNLQINIVVSKHSVAYDAINCNIIFSYL